MINYEIKYFERRKKLIYYEFEIFSNKRYFTLYINQNINMKKKLTIIKN